MIIDSASSEFIGIHHCGVKIYRCEVDASRDRRTSAVMVRRVSGRVWVVFTKYAKVFTLQRILSETGMDSGEGLQDPPGLVDPEVRAYVYSLVSAVCILPHHLRPRLIRQ